MPRRFICRHDHEWETSSAPGETLGTINACPVCGISDFTCLQDDDLADEPATGFAPSLPGSGPPLPRVPDHDIIETECRVR